MTRSFDDAAHDFGAFALSDHPRSGRHAPEYGTLAELARLIWPTESPTPALCRKLAEALRLARAIRWSLDDGTDVMLFETIAPTFCHRARPSTRVGWCVCRSAMMCGADRLAAPFFCDAAGVVS